MERGGGWEYGGCNTNRRAYNIEDNKNKTVT